VIRAGALHYLALHERARRSVARDTGASAFIHRPTTAAKHRRFLPAPFFVQFKFQPSAARAVFGVPLHELVDRVVPIAEIWGREGSELLEALTPLEGNTRAFVAAREGSLLRRLDRGKAMSGREACGDRGMAELALEHGFYDQARLNAEFRALLRVTPRDFLRGRLPFATPR
jgi:AraC-like DNA-binding protein